MHRSMLSVASVAALTAVIATVCTLAAVHFTQPEVVQAQKPERAGTQIALVNLELLSRRSPLFAKDRDKWVKAKAQLDEHRKSLEDKYEELKAKVRRSADSEDLLMLKVELQSYEESIKACRQQHQDYLAALLDELQRETQSRVGLRVGSMTGLRGGHFLGRGAGIATQPHAGRQAVLEVVAVAHCDCDLLTQLGRSRATAERTERTPHAA